MTGDLSATIAQGEGSNLFETAARRENAKKTTELFLKTLKRIESLPFGAGYYGKELVDEFIKQTQIGGGIHLVVAPDEETFIYGYKNATLHDGTILSYVEIDIPAQYHKEPFEYSDENISQMLSYGVGKHYSTIQDRFRSPLENNLEGKIKDSSWNEKFELRKVSH